MKESKIVGFDKAKLAESMMKLVVEEQNQRFIEYARDTIQKIGGRIREYHSRNNMDRSGNLLDSLCWGVSYNGKLVKGGFYRSAKASYDSGLHEWSKVSFKDKDSGHWVDHMEADEPVNGHQLALEYIFKYGNNGGMKGWKVFFAILAPYWGYWEKGFTLKHGFSSNGGFTGSTFKQFAVMTEFYDILKGDLVPARVRKPRISVAKYASKSLYSRAKKNYYG